MSGDQERDAPFQHPTEREKFEEWLKTIKPEDDWSPFVVWQAASELKQKEIAQLKSRLHEISTDWQVNQAKLAMCVTLLNNVTFKGDYLECQDTNGKNWFDLRQEALAATEQDVSKWKREIEAKAIEECAEKFMFGVGYELRQLAQQKRSE